MSASRRLARGVAAGLVSALVALAGAELLVRLAGERMGIRSSGIWELRGYVCHGQSRFQPRAHTGWVFDPARPQVNSSGFLGPDLPIERGSRGSRTAGVLRIACLGGSTTAGNLYEGYENSYPGWLARVLEERSGQPVEVLNLGVPGWTSAESLVNYFLNAQDYRCDLVLLHHAINDVFPRLWPGFRSDYSHYFHPWSQPRFSLLRRVLTRWSALYAAWELESFSFELAAHVSVPRERLAREHVAELRPATALPFRRNLESIARDVEHQGGTPVFLTMPRRDAPPFDRLEELLIAGLDEHNAIVRALAEQHGWPVVDLAASEDEDLRASFIDLVHLSSAGNHRKAELVGEFLIGRGLSHPFPSGEPREIR